MCRGVLLAMRTFVIHMAALFMMWPLFSYAQDIREKVDAAIRIASTNLLIKSLYEQPSVVNEKDHLGQIPLHKAAMMDDENVLVILIFAGSNINAKDNLGRTPLMLAALFRRDKCVSCLLKAGAEPRLVDYSGKTARDYAMQHIVTVIRSTFGTPVDNNKTGIILKMLSNSDEKSSSGQTEIGGPGRQNELDGTLQGAGGGGA